MARNLDLETWRSFFADVGLEASLSDAYLEYASRLIDASLPVIFDLGHLAALLGRTEGYIASVINAPENHYRKFEIPKRRLGNA